MAWYTLGGQVVLGPTGNLLDSGSGGPPPPPVPPLANDLFPRTSWQVIAPGGGSGTSYAYANATFQANAAKFNIVNPGSYAGIEQTMGNTTFATIFNNIKNLSIANGFPTPTRCILYVMSSEQSTVGGGGNASSYTVWSNMIQNANWWIRNTNTGSGAGWPNGAIVTNDTNSGDFATISGNAVLDSGGRTFGQGFWFHYDGLLRQGNGVALGYASNLSFAANANLDGYQMDNVFCTPRQSGSWNMDTTIYASGNATAAAFLQQGQALQVAALKAINPNLIVMGNCDYFGHATSTFSTLVTLDPSQNGLFDMVYCQSAIGGPNGMEGQGVTTTAQFMTNMIAAEAQMASTGTLIFEQCGPSHGATFSNTSQASWTAADWQSCRFGAAMCFMRNWHYELNYNENYSPTAPYFIDEVLAQSGAYGWLGNPIDSPQSAARTSGVWWRQFQNGVVFMNPKGNGSQTLDVTSLGLPSNLSAIANVGYGDPTINTGAAVTHITLSDRDGRFLIGSSQLVHGQSFTITGSGFGTKSRGVAPLTYDVATAAVGTKDPVWSGGVPFGATDNPNFNLQLQNAGFSPTGATIGSPSPYIGKIYAGCPAQSGYPNGNANLTEAVAMWYNFTRPTGDYCFYWTWYRRCDPNWTFQLSSTKDDNFKPFYFNGGWDSYQAGNGQYGYLSFSAPGTSNNSQTSHQMVIDSSGCYQYGPGVINSADGTARGIFFHSALSPFNPANGWIKQEVEFYCTATHGWSGVGGPGRIDMFENGNHSTNIYGYQNYTDEPSFFTTSQRNWAFGSFQRDGGPLATNNYQYFGGPMMFDMTAGGMSSGAHVARVLVGSTNNYNALGVFETQACTSWADGSITFTFFKGALTGGSTGYVWVQPEQGSPILAGSFVISNTP